jgi:hypothetical protein
MEADAIRFGGDLVDEFGEADAVAAQGQVNRMLLYGAKPDDHDRRGLVLEPILECGTREFPKPESFELSIFAHKRSRIELRLEF